MTSSLQNPARIRQPRSRQAPSPRDQQLYLDYQTTGKRQIDLAEQYKLTQCRVSQIIRRVESWLTSTLDLGPETLDSAARERLQYRVQYERLNEAGRLAMQHFHQQHKIVTHKKGARAGKEFKETTKRLLPPSLQCLKVVVQTSAQLTRLQASRGSQAPGHAPLTHQAAPAAPEERPLSREQVEAWLVEHHEDAARADKVSRHFDANYLIHDLVDTLTGESKNSLALHTLARDAGLKVVQRRPYEDQSPPIPPRDGWYYGMYDADGGLVAWLHADQFANAITPDYPPVSRSSLDSSTPTRSVSEGNVVPRSPDDAVSTPPSSTSNELKPLLTPCSSTSPSDTDSPQPTSTPALTALSPQTQFHPPYEPEPFDLESIQSTFHAKGCSD